MGIFRDQFNPTLRKLKEDLQDLQLANDNLKQIQSEELNDLSNRLEQLQKQFDNSGKRTISKPAQMLLFYHLGLFKVINNMDIQVKQKAKLIGALLDMGSENIEKNLSRIGRGFSDYEKDKAYQELTDFLYDIGLDESAKVITTKKKTK